MTTIKPDPQLLFDSIRAQDLNSLRELISLGCDANFPIEEGLTPLMLASGEVNIEMVKILLEAGANVDDVDNYGYSPLMIALENNDLDIFHYLEPFTNSEIKKIALLTSIMNGDLAKIEILLTTGINVNQCREKGVWRENGRTALIVAIQEGFSEIVQALLEYGADPNLRDEDSGTTPLISAIRVANEKLFLPLYSLEQTYSLVTLMAVHQ